ncbi:MAG: hydrolase, partial [Proteobacteria bacterium]|nr:hydrolase [Pseudomonadota bacterium]
MNRTETTRQADEGAEAWRVPPCRYLREHPPGHQGERLSSRYVSVRDGTRLAVDVHLPGDVRPPEIAPEPGPYPTVVLFTPYYR